MFNVQYWVSKGGSIGQKGDHNKVCPGTTNLITVIVYILSGYIIFLGTVYISVCYFDNNNTSDNNYDMYKK